MTNLVPPSKWNRYVRTRSELAQQISERADHLGITLDELAAATSTTATKIANGGAGIRGLTYREVGEIARCLDCPTDDLIYQP